MKIFTSNFTTVPDKGLCACPIRLYESPLTGQRVSIRRPNELKTVIFPSGVIGGRGQFNSARAIIERIDGVIAVSLIFCQTAVRVLFDAHRTGPEAIDNALNTMVSADDEKPEITRRYNIILIPVAAGVLAPFESLPMMMRQRHPILAALAMAMAMAMSSISVVSNSLRLYKADIQ